MNAQIDAAFVGRVLDTPEIKTSAGGKPWTAIRLACGDGENTQYVRVVLFGEMAQQIAASADKGCKLYVEGSIRLDRWKGAAGEERSGLSLTASKAEKVGTSAIGRNKPAKRDRGEGASPQPSTRPEVDQAARRASQQPLDDCEIPF